MKSRQINNAHCPSILTRCLKKEFWGSGLVSASAFMDSVPHEKNCSTPWRAKSLKWCHAQLMCLVHGEFWKASKFKSARVVLKHLAVDVRFGAWIARQTPLSVLRQRASFLESHGKVTWTRQCTHLQLRKGQPESWGGTPIWRSIQYIKQFIQHDLAVLGSVVLPLPRAGIL